MAPKKNNHNQKITNLERDLKFLNVLIQCKRGEEKVRILREIKSVEQAKLVELKRIIEKTKKENENMEKALKTIERMEKEGKPWRHLILGNKDQSELHQA
jgi:hypothetical protein